MLCQRISDGSLYAAQAGFEGEPLYFSEVAQHSPCRFCVTAGPFDHPALLPDNLKRLLTCVVEKRRLSYSADLSAAHSAPAFWAP
jgi:hypothetical protein